MYYIFYVLWFTFFLVEHIYDFVSRLSGVGSAAGKNNVTFSPGVTQRNALTVSLRFLLLKGQNLANFDRAKVNRRDHGRR